MIYTALLLTLNMSTILAPIVHDQGMNTANNTSVIFNRMPPLHRSMFFLSYLLVFIIGVPLCYYAYLKASNQNHKKMTSYIQLRDLSRV